jgi:hypothetical protein
LKRSDRREGTRRTDGRDRALLATALGFAGATGYNSVVAIREQLPGEPLGIRIPLSVSTGILLGWGSAVAAPWSMPVAALLAAGRRAGRAGTTRPALICAAVGAAGLAGILMEPNTYKRRSWSPATRRAVVAHVATCVTLAGAGISGLRHTRRTDAR